MQSLSEKIVDAIVSIVFVSTLYFIILHYLAPWYSESPVLIEIENYTKIVNFSLSETEIRYPSMKMSMKDLNILTDMLSGNISFGFSHFNDGEIMSISNCRYNETIDFGWQTCSKHLSQAMLAALVRPLPNFFVGIPCFCEFKGIPFFLALKYLNVTYLNATTSLDIECPVSAPLLNFSRSTLNIRSRLTVATLFTNGNYHHTKYQMSKILKKVSSEQHRKVHIIVGVGHNAHRLPFPVDSVYLTPRINAFETTYAKLRTRLFLSRYRAGDIVLLMCGPLGRILASEWTALRQDLTFVEMGSFWDEELWGRKHYNKNQNVPCMHRRDVSIH